MDKKVSIIVPIYNSAKYLRECLDSIVNQTFIDIEIILVDDCSTDNSVEICEEYMKKDCRIKLFKKDKNSGAGESRNIGIDLAQADYITFFDSDDYMEPDTIEKMYNQAVNSDADITLCGSREYYQKEKVFKIFHESLEITHLNKKTIFSPADIKDYIFQFCVGWPWDKLYKKDFIARSGIRFQTLKHSEDLSFVYGLLVCADKITYIKDICITHRKHSASVESTRDCAPDCFYWALLDLIRILNEKGLYETYKKSLINLCLNFSLWQIRTIKKNKIMKDLYKKLLIKIDYSGDSSDIYKYSDFIGTKSIFHPFLTKFKRILFVLKYIL